ncbi:cell division cycle 20, cofactor-APC complex [Saprolegnia diclina VS20]|uniref:Cell division cycle 20, cofactor-APC complex n=1 Tax=Saprolegnia diclina (strain VS20) TaxID=1156394 RepID=T0R0Q0_SAPDV|nr:cell division cycle 20, cofactor-APC complex [Saprolegnia diclina VS20]EQC25548.1 cell division cycle 20, cofactor-APC complex [Saprolegnia diclina VS20]|eukprot:XP_008621004.1 cell division cycle 20, cofactor-APC complex [Saprolegnia diclina VS20]
MATSSTPARTPPRSLSRSSTNKPTPSTAKDQAKTKKQVNAAAEMELLLQMTAGPLESSVIPRWKRKKKVEAVSPSPAKRKKITNDRFIPNRSAMDMKVSSLKVTAPFEAKAAQPSVANPTPASIVAPDSPSQQTFQTCLAKSLLGTSDLEGHRILTFKDKPPAADDPASFKGALNVMYNKRATSSKIKPLLTRHIPSAPTKVLDAPELMDDYYLNLLSWGKNNVLAVALGASLYLWNAATGAIDELMALDGDEYISSVSWIQEGSTLAVGSSDATVQLWDTTNAKLLRTLNGHSARVGALSWNRHVLSSGSRDTSIIHHDVRVASHIVATLNSHEQEVCGLRWSPDGSKLASGGNDNALCIWNQMQTTPMHKLTDHCAAVKALAWCPWDRHVLASGGGTADRTIKLWNAQTGSLLQSTDTGSQVCALLWSTSEKELLSSHGYAQNELCLWSYPAMRKVKELTGHSARVLHLAAGPDATTVVSGAADETLRFWNIFSPPAVSSKAKVPPATGLRAASIR